MKRISLMLFALFVLLSLTGCGKKTVYGKELINTTWILNTESNDASDGTSLATLAFGYEDDVTLTLLGEESKGGYDVSEDSISFTFEDKDLEAVYDGTSIVLTAHDTPLTFTKQG